MLSEAEFTDIFLHYGFVRVNGDGREVKPAPRNESLRRFDYPPQARKHGVLAILMWSAATPPYLKPGQAQMHPNLVRMNPNFQYGRGESEQPLLRRFTPHSGDELRARIEALMRLRFDVGIEEVVRWWGTPSQRPELKHVPPELMDMAMSPDDEERRSAQRVLADWMLDNGIWF